MRRKSERKSKYKNYPVSKLLMKKVQNIKLSNTCYYSDSVPYKIIYFLGMFAHNLLCAVW